MFVFDGMIVKTSERGRRRNNLLLLLMTISCVRHFGKGFIPVERVSTLKIKNKGLLEPVIQVMNKVHCALWL